MPAFFACCTCPAPEEQHESQEGNLISRDFFEEEQHILAVKEPKALKVLEEDILAIEEVARNPKPTLPTKVETEVAAAKPLVVQITKPTAASGLGLGLDVTPGAPIHIYDIVAGGPISKHNEVADADRQIQVGSYLSAVNGVREVQRILDAVSTSVTSEVEVWRSEVWTVSLEKKSAADSLGLQLDYCDNGRSLIISGIDEGAVRAFNEGNSSAAIRMKDRILAVNGVEGSPSSLMSSLTSTSITLKMSRPAGPATSTANSEDEEGWRAAVAAGGG